MGQQDIQTEILRKMTPADKLKAAMRLYWSARRLKAAAIRQQHPDWNEQQVLNAVTEAFVNART